VNPYVKILNTMKTKGAESNPPGIVTGTVISPPPNLIIQTKDLQIYHDDILIAEHLLNTTITTLIKGDQVAIMPTVDLQTWIILSKVVSI